MRTRRVGMKRTNQLLNALARLQAEAGLLIVIRRLKYPVPLARDYIASFIPCRSSQRFTG